MNCRLYTGMLTLVLVSIFSFANADQSAFRDWTSIISDPCQRCVSANLYNAPIRIPIHSVVYSFSGEFAHKVDWWLINLDTGEVTERESISVEPTKWQTETRNFLIADAKALSDVRASAAKLWCSKLPLNIAISPGADEEDYVISIDRMVPFFRLSPVDSFFTTAVEVALKPFQPAN